MRSVVKWLMESVGEDATKFGAHSLRIGGATAALTAGVPPATIRLMGRWATDCYEVYLRLTRQTAARMSAIVGSTAFEDLERGFHSEQLELLPYELECGDFSIDADESDGEEDAE